MAAIPMFTASNVDELFDVQMTGEDIVTLTYRKNRKTMPIPLTFSRTAADRVADLIQQLVTSSPSGEFDPSIMPDVNIL